MEQQMRDMRQDLVKELTYTIRQEIIKKVTNQIKNIVNEEKLINTTAEIVMDNIREEQDKEKRKNNLVLYKVPETENQDIRQCEKEDERFCQDLFQNSL